MEEKLITYNYEKIPIEPVSMGSYIIIRYSAEAFSDFIQFGITNNGLKASKPQERSLCQLMLTQFTPLS
jgi:hypothetical protein